MSKITINPSEPFKGFVNFFTKKSNNNIMNYITAEGATLWGPAYTCINYSITGTEPSDQWASPQEKENANIFFTFLFPIYLKYYTLRTFTYSSGTLPKGWIVEGSNDKMKWTRIDTKENRSEFTKTGDYHTFTCDSPSLFARYIRFNLTTPNSIGRYHFHISRIEFFGTINNYGIVKTCSRNAQNRVSCIIILLIS